MNPNRQQYGTRDWLGIELWARWFSIYDRLPRWAQRLVPGRLR